MQAPGDRAESACPGLAWGASDVPSLEKKHDGMVTAAESMSIDNEDLEEGEIYEPDAPKRTNECRFAVKDSISPKKKKRKTV